MSESNKATESNPFQACQRQDVVDQIRDSYKDLGGWKSREQLPVMYHEMYNTSFWGFEKLHPFDSTKFGKVVKALIADGLITEDQLVSPVEATDAVLLGVHTPAYLERLSQSKSKVVKLTELFLLYLVPNRVLQRKIVRPARYHAAGTILGAALAMEHGWAVNIGGGMHHAYFDDASDGGWCFYSDVTLAIRKLREASAQRVQKFMIIDTDVHQGNGNERDKLHFEDSNVFILDVYNADIWPEDEIAKKAIDQAVELKSGTTDEEYLSAFRQGLESAFAAFVPDFIMFNAGCDILVGDPLGELSVSAEALMQRDVMVFEAALKAKVPVLYLLSGGYARNNHKVIAGSIGNLMRTFGLISPWKK